MKPEKLPLIAIFLAVFWQSDFRFPAKNRVATWLRACQHSFHLWIISLTL
jgi:hypothetical protein